MSHHLSFLLVATLSGLGLSAHAEETADDPATACVRTKAWEARQQGWNLRALDSVALRSGQLRAWPMALAPNLTYRFLTCGEEGIEALDLLVVDGDGNVIVRGEESGREPMVEHAPDSPARVHLVVRPRRVINSEPHHAAIAVMYR